MVFFWQLFSYSQKWRCSTQRLSQIWLLQAKNEKEFCFWKTSFNILGCLLEPCVYKSDLLFVNFFSEYWKSQKAHDFSTFTFQCTILVIYIYIYEKTSLLISLCILRDLLQQKIPRDLGKSPYICTFPCSHEKIFWWDGSGKLKNTSRKGTDHENKKKQEAKNGGKEKKKFFLNFFGNIPGGSPYSCVLHRLGMPSCYRPCATLPQENPLVSRVGTSPTT